MAEESVRDSEGAGVSGSEILRCNCSLQNGIYERKEKRLAPEGVDVDCFFLAWLDPDDQIL